MRLHADDEKGEREAGVGLRSVCGGWGGTEALSGQKTTSHHLSLLRERRRFSLH